MSYRLGVDLGTTYTAAAIRSGGRTTMLALGNRALQVPSVLFVKPDGEVLVGEAAERRGAVEPERLAREFKRRVGDPVPILVGGTPYSAQALLARLLAWSVDVATERQGERPAEITVTHPASWGPFKKDVLEQAIRLADLAGATLLPEPEAAAIMYASRNRMAVGDAVVVYDLGGGTFDAAVVRRTESGFELVGTPEGVEHLGGVDFDEAVFEHVRAALGDQLGRVTATGDELVVALARLRRDCVEAKEALSTDTETVVPVVLPGVNTSVRLTRGELEEMLRPALTETIGAVQRVLRSADLPAEQVSAIVLVGGSSRIPLVSELLVGAFHRRVTLDTHPKHDVALGAALAGALPAAAGPEVKGSAAAAPTRGPGPSGVESTVELAVQSHRTAAPVVTDPATRPDRPPQPPGAPRPRSPSPVVLAACGLPLVALLVAAVGPGARVQPNPAWRDVTVQQDRIADGSVTVDLSKDVPVAGLSDVADDRSAVVLRLTLAGARVASSPGRVAGHQATVQLKNARLLFAGPVKARLEATRGGRSTETQVMLTPKRRWFASVPGAGLVALLLFVAAYAEAIIRPLRRRRQARTSDLVSLSLLGAAAGVAFVLASWTIGQRLLLPVAAVLIVLAMGAAGTCVALAAGGAARNRKVE
jgi:molecular chaperone DnaK